MPPWNGVYIGKDAPEVVTEFIEVVPNETAKYEIDEESGYLRLDRPQKYSNIIPVMIRTIKVTSNNFPTLVSASKIVSYNFYLSVLIPEDFVLNIKHS